MYPATAVKAILGHDTFTLDSDVSTPVRYPAHTFLRFKTPEATKECLLLICRKKKSLWSTDTQTNTNTHTIRQTKHRHTDKQKHIHTEKQSHRHTDTQTHRHIHIQTHRHTDTQTHRHIDIQTHRNTKPGGPVRVSIRRVLRLVSGRPSCLPECQQGDRPGKEAPKDGSFQKGDGERTIRGRQGGHR